jgi:protein associated with RNAse G/E
LTTLRPGTGLPVQSTKYGGGQHYRYPLTVVRDDGDRLVAWGPAGTQMDSYRGRYPATRHMLHVHWADRDWNLSVMWRPDWRPRSHYVNIALPSTWSDGVLRFVDLDLDVIQVIDGTVRLDDEDEFEEHRVTLRYPPEVVDRARAAFTAVQELVHRRAWPFDGSLYAWRPGDADLPAPLAAR